MRSAVALLLINGFCCHFARADCLSALRVLNPGAMLEWPALSAENQKDLDKKWERLFSRPPVAPTGLSPEAQRSHKKLLQLFRLAYETSDEETGKSLWTKYLKELGHYLDLNGVRWISVVVQGHEGIEILPEENGRALNALAYLTKANFGARTLYLPQTMQKMPALAFVHWKGFGAQMLAVSTQAMLGLRPGILEGHEAIHLQSVELIDLGRESLFHGLLKRKDGKGEGSYANSLNLDELYTHAADAARQLSWAPGKAQLGTVIAERILKAVAQAKKQLDAGDLPTAAVYPSPSGKMIPTLTLDLGDETLTLYMARESMRSKFEDWSKSLVAYRDVEWPNFQKAWEQKLRSQVDPKLVRELDYAIETQDYEKVARWVKIEFVDQGSSEPTVRLRFQGWKPDGSTAGSPEYLDIGGKEAERLISAATEKYNREKAFSEEALAAARERLDVLERVAGDSLADFKAIQAAAKDPAKLRQIHQKPYRRMAPFFNWK